MGGLAVLLAVGVDLWFARGLELEGEPGVSLEMRRIPADLEVPSLSKGPPGPGRRVREVLPEYERTSAYHVLYLPTDWTPGRRYPVVVEYGGNGPYYDRYDDVSTGLVEGTNLGYGISGGEGFLWVSLPFLNGAGTAPVRTWWGDPPENSVEPTVAYCKLAVPWICARYGGDPDRVILAGFSRGSLACNVIGLHDDEIAGLWAAFVPFSHYDGVREDWGYPGADRASAGRRLARLGGRPQCIVEIGEGGSGFLAATRRYLESTGVDAPFTFVPTGFRNHSDAWILRLSPARSRLRAWIADVLADPPPRPSGDGEGARNRAR